MKILLLNPPALSGVLYMKELGRCGRKSVSGEIWPQTGLAYLAAVLVKNGYDCKIIDGMAEDKPFNLIFENIKSFSPDIVVMGVSTPTFDNDNEICSIIKKSLPVKIILVGTHVAVLPEQSLCSSEADFGIINEGELTLLELVDCLSKNRDNYSDVKGICFKNKSGEIVCNSPRELVKDLDSLPFPSRNLLPSEKYHMPFFPDGPFATLISSRGCPYSCTFCRAGKVWGETTRRRSVDNVHNEIKHIVCDLKIKNIVFMTDLFTIDKKWVSQLCEKIISEGPKFTWICNSRVDSVDLGVLNLMKRSGCKLISYGVESGDQGILDSCRKNIRVEDSKNAIKLTKKSGILSFAYFILGLPGETKSTIEKTINFAIELDSDYVNFHIATPFPGTEFYETAKKNGWLMSEKWSDYEEEGSCVVRTEELSCEDLKKYQQIAMKKFYFRPGQFLKELGRIKSPREFFLKLRAASKILRIGK